jgi:pantoate--beta-alanine ligase
VHEVIQIAVARTVADIRRWRSAATTPVALVPTMGALHDGHMALVAAARRLAPSLVVSVFVNPLQFGPGEDFARYPRDLDADVARLSDAGVDAVFAPARDELVPPDMATTVSVRGITERFEGAVRPGHFDGVATIVTKLCTTTQPDVAVFGEKDFQQLQMIRRLVDDLDLPVEIHGVPIVRDHDGLALSSRNAYLSANERRRALALPTALRTAAQRWDGDADRARHALWSVLGPAGMAVDYADVVDETTLEPLSGAGHPTARAVVAGRVGATRLIDNRRLGAD